MTGRFLKLTSQPAACLLEAVTRLLLPRTLSKLPFPVPAGIWAQERGKLMELRGRGMIFALCIIYRLANERTRQAQHVNIKLVEVMVGSLSIPSLALFLPIFFFSRLGLYLDDNCLFLLKLPGEWHKVVFSAAAPGAAERRLPRQPLAMWAPWLSKQVHGRNQVGKEGKDRAPTWEKQNTGNFPRLLAALVYLGALRS